MLRRRKVIRGEEMVLITEDIKTEEENLGESKTWTNDEVALCTWESR